MLCDSPLLALMTISDALPTLPTQIIYSFIHIVNSIQSAERVLSVGDAAESELNTQPLSSWSRQSNGHPLPPSPQGTLPLHEADLPTLF